MLPFPEFVFMLFGIGMWLFLLVLAKLIQLHTEKRNTLWWDGPQD